MTRAHVRNNVPGAADTRPLATTLREDAIKLRQLRYFVQAVAEGNITQAARSLNVSQPSLGVQIRLLEDEIGLPLLERHSRGIRPTAAGDFLYQRARDVLHRVDGLTEEVRALNRATPRRVVLGLPPSVIRLLGHDLLRFAEEQLAGVALSLVEERSAGLVQEMERGDIDLAFAYETEEREGVWRRPVLTEELVYVTAPAQAPSDRRIALRDALTASLAIADGRGLIRRLVEREANRLGIELTLAYEIHSVSALQSILQQGQASGIMPYGLAADDMARGLLAGSRIEPPVLRRLFVERLDRKHASLDQLGLETILIWIQDAMKRRLGSFFVC